MGALTALAVWLLVVSADKVPEPPSGPNPFLVQAKDLYSKLEFEKCLKRVGQAQQWRSSPKELMEIELYAGLCHFNLGQKPDAEERFKTALRIDERAELPPYTTPPAVTMFNKLKKSMKPTLAEREKDREREKEKDRDREKEREREREKERERERERPPPPPERTTPEVVESPPEEKPAPKPEVVEVEPPPREKERHEFPDEPGERHSDVPVVKKLTPKKAPVEDQVAAPPPHFIARKAPAIAITGVAAVGLAMGIGFGAASKDLETRARAAEFESDFLALKQKAEGNAVGADISYGVAGVAAVVAIVLWVTGN